MGGIVATSLLPSNRISAILTMSAPHTLPPARFDARIDEIYHANKQALFSDPTPIVSLCGGATDMMIPSESCILPPIAGGDIYRKTIFTSALEGAWTGVGHQEMVWCHQVRWRIARAALELGAANNAKGRRLVLDKWLRDGQTLPPEIGNGDDTLRNLDESASQMIPEGSHLSVERPMGSVMHLLPISRNSTTSDLGKFVLLVSQGSIGPVSPQNSLPLTVSVYSCSLTSECRSLKPTTLRLIPNPISGQTFPVPREGSDESEGVAVYEAEVSGFPADGNWVGVRVENGDGRGWVVGGFSHEQVLDLETSTAGKS